MRIPLYTFGPAKQAGQKLHKLNPHRKLSSIHEALARELGIATGTTYMGARKPNRSLLWPKSISSGLQRSSAGLPIPYSMPSSSTSKMSVAFGGMTPPAPRAP